MGKFLEVNPLQSQTQIPAAERGLFAIDSDKLIIFTNLTYNIIDTKYMAARTQYTNKIRDFTLRNRP